MCTTNVIQNYHRANVTTRNHKTTTGSRNHSKEPGLKSPHEDGNLASPAKTEIYSSRKQQIRTTGTSRTCSLGNPETHISATAQNSLLKWGQSPKISAMTACSGGGIIGRKLPRIWRLAAQPARVIYPAFAHSQFVRFSLPPPLPACLSLIHCETSGERRRLSFCINDFFPPSPRSGSRIFSGREWRFVKASRRKLLFLPPSLCRFGADDCAVEANQ